MRVISGKRRGLKLIAPEGLDTRPTTDRVKESVFNIIQTHLPCGFVLDMFAGSGAMGIEALSRGAAGAIFIENSPAAHKIVKANLEASRLGGAILFNSDAFALLERLAAEGASAPNGERFDPKQGFDIIFLDPPYNKGLVQKALSEIRRRDLLAEDGIIVAETERGGEDLSDCGFSVIKEAKYGKTVITVMQR